MNIYQMYHKNGCKFGFVVQRHSWGNTIAEVYAIKGVQEGERIKGKPPYYGNPVVYAHFYKNGIFVPEWTELSCPGNYSYEMIQPSIETEKDSEEFEIWKDRVIPFITDTIERISDEIENGGDIKSVFNTGLTLLSENGDRYNVGIVISLHEETETGKTNKSEQ